MRVLVTGAAGFIGSHVCRALVARPEVTAVVGLDDLSTGRISNLDGVEMRLIEGSMLDERLLATAVDGVDSIVHLGARPSVPRSIAEPVAAHYANTAATLQVLEAARAAGGPHLVVASSSSVYGANPQLPKHEAMAARPLSPYAATKLAAEQYTLAWQYSYGIPAIVFRFFNVYGPRQWPGEAYANAVPAFVDAALRGVPLPVHGDGTQSRDFTYVGSLADVVADAVVRRVSHPTAVNLAFGERVSLLDLIERLEALVGHRLERHHTDPRAGDVDHTQADTTLFESLFPGFEPIGLDAGLAATVAWLRDKKVPGTTLRMRKVVPGTFLSTGRS